MKKEPSRKSERKPNMTSEFSGVFRIATVLGRPKLHFKTSKEEWHWKTLQALTEALEVNL